MDSKYALSAALEIIHALASLIKTLQEELVEAREVRVPVSEVPQTKQRAQNGSIGARKTGSVRGSMPAAWRYSIADATSGVPKTCSRCGRVGYNVRTCIATVRTGGELGEVPQNLIGPERSDQKHREPIAYIKKKERGL